MLQSTLIHSLLENRLSWLTSLQFALAYSECCCIGMAVQTNISLNISDGHVDSSPVHSYVYVDSVCMFIMGIIVVVGIIGNSLTFVVFRKGNFKSSTSFLFLSLSLIDSAVLLTDFTLIVLRYVLDHTDIQLDYSGVRSYLTVGVNRLFCIAGTATTWVTVLIAVNRYIIVCLPLRASQWCTLSKVKIQLAVVLVLVVLYNIPEFVRSRVVHRNRNNVTYYEIQHDWYQSFPEFYLVYDNGLNCIALLCLPLIILTLLTVRLINAMKAHRRMQAERQHSQPDSSMTFALVIVVIVFIICQAPWLVLGAMWPCRQTTCDVVRHYVSQIQRTLLALNSAANFIIYIVVNTRFRDVIITNVCRRQSFT